MSEPALIQLKGVTKQFGHFSALRPIDLVIERGEFVCVVGPSGCGKSTLLRLVAGLALPSHGEIRLEGRLVERPQTNVGIVFQNAVLLAWRSIMDNILLAAEMRNMNLQAARQRAQNLMLMAGLQGFEDKYPWQLSGGMQQRASICRALLHDPDVLLMDEPFGALDAMTREKMNIELQRIWLESKKTVLLITHSIPEAVYLGDRVVVMSERPGAIDAIYDINLARPRGIEAMAHPDFAALARRIRSHFYVQGAALDA